MKLRWPDLLFLAIVLLLCNWHFDRSFNANTVSRAAMVAAVVEHGSFQIDPYHHLTEDKAHVGEHYYSEKAPLPSLLMIPIWWIATAIGLAQPGENGLLTDGLLHLSGSFTGGVPLALIMLWTWRKLRRQQTPITASWLATLPFLGSFLFIYAGSFYGHLIAGMFLLFAWDRYRKGEFFLAGIFSSAAVLCEYSLFVFPLIWCIQLIATRSWKSVKELVLGGIPALILLLIMNSIITGDPFSLPYSQVNSHADAERIFGLDFPSIKALFGLLIGPYRGLFIFAPITLLCAIMIIQRIGKMSFRAIFLHPLIIPSVLLVLLIASHSMWWGGWAIGPRHLTSIAILLLAAGLPLLPSKQIWGWLILVLSFIGIVVIFAAKSTIGYSAPTEVTHPITDLILPSFRGKFFTEMQLPVLFGADPMASTFAFFLVFIASLFVLKILDRKLQPN